MPWPNKDKDNYKYRDKDNDKDKYIKRAPSKSNPRDLCPLRDLIRVTRRHDMTKKRTMTKTITKTDTKTDTKTMTNTFREQLQRAIPETCDLCNIWSEWWGDMTRPKRETITMTNTETKTMTKTNTFREHLQRAILETCEIWDNDYNFDNWEPEFMTICVTWQLRVTLDSIRNSCDVFFWGKTYEMGVG